MNKFTDYESWGFSSLKTTKPALLEAYSGVQIVGWYGAIERQVNDLRDEYRRNKNYDDAEKVAQFLETWRGNQLTGSLNVDTVNVLEAAAAQLSVDRWKAANYFGHLRDQLRMLRAGEEELPRAMPPETKLPRRSGGPSGSRGMPTPPASQFGPETKEVKTGTAPNPTPTEPTQPAPAPAAI